MSNLDNIIAPHADEAMTAMELESQGLEVAALQALVSPFPGKELIAAMGQAVKVRISGNRLVICTSISEMSSCR